MATNMPSALFFFKEIFSLKKVESVMQLVFVSVNKASHSSLVKPMSIKPVPLKDKGKVRPIKPTTLPNQTLPSETCFLPLKSGNINYKDTWLVNPRDGKI